MNQSIRLDMHILAYSSPSMSLSQRWRIASNGKFILTSTMIHDDRTRSTIKSNYFFSLLISAAYNIKPIVMELNMNEQLLPTQVSR